MTCIQTMGTSSCATSAIGGFKDGQRALNEEFKKDPKAFIPPKDGYSVDEYFNRVLYPPAQNLGRSHDLPFTKLMEDIEKSALSTKFIIATLNRSQFLANDRYWKKELEKWGFKLVAKTKNEIGQMPNYIFVRNPNAMEIEDEEK